MLDVTVVLTLYRRPQNLARQVEAIRAQSFPPKNVWLWVNYHEDNADLDLSYIDVDRIIECSDNAKFHGRFAAALLADTKYVAIFDDDTIPGVDWFKNCVDTECELIKEGYKSPILGTAGVTLNSFRYENHYRCGWPTQNPETQRVDLVGHAWFFNRQNLAYFWAYRPFSFENGEDIQFAANAQIVAGVQSFCPPHPAGQSELWGSLYAHELGTDNVATSNNTWLSHAKFFSQRDKIVRYALKRGWSTVKSVTL